MTAPSFATVAARPKSIGLLILSIGVAFAFAFLGQWQLSRAVQNGDILERPTETVLTLQDVAAPQEPVGDQAVGQLVRADGAWVEGDFLVLAERFDEGRDGFWVIGRWGTGDAATLAVAAGWTPEEAVAVAAAREWNSAGGPALDEVAGRYLQSESPTPPLEARKHPTEMSIAALVNDQWQDAIPAYTGYLTLGEAPAPLADITSPAPQTEVELNFLNLFYAVEWVLFSAAALYIWYRLVRDDWEKEQDGPAESEEDGARATATTPEAPIAR
ncbi:MAG: conserved rane protein [Naasia sp.]|nr:conserved rane protein [Naasia sp.]